MANNQILYNAAIAGICGGTQERWITATVPDTYDTLQQAGAALATAIDALIPTDSDIGEDFARVLQSLTQGVMSNRYIVSVDADDYADIAAAIVACYTEIITAITPISPPSGNNPTIGIRFTLEPNETGSIQIVSLTSTGGWPEAIGMNFILSSFNSAGFVPTNIGVCGARIADEFGNVTIVFVVPIGFLGSDCDVIFEASLVTT